MGPGFFGGGFRHTGTHAEQNARRQEEKNYFFCYAVQKIIRKKNMLYYLGLSLLSNPIGIRNRQNQNLSAQARLILSEFEGRPIHDDDMAREANGRPFFPNREACDAADFNITHSGALAAVSYIRGGNLRTGCDVERLRPRTTTKAIAEKAFSDSEVHYIFARQELAETRFLEIWTLKECFLKLRGLSVFDMSAVPSFIHDDDFAFGAAVSSPLSFSLYELSGSGERYILAAAIEGTKETEGIEQPQPAIRWFSQPVLTCRSIAAIKAALSPAQTVSPKI